MRYVEVSPTLRLRHGHLLLMVYRYLSGIYQIGDLCALNYVKGYLDSGPTPIRPKGILTVSGHGIGEAEMWLADRLNGCEIDTMSFRLLDTQLLQFLRRAGNEDIEKAFELFRQEVSPHDLLFELSSDPGLVPYWTGQAEAIKCCFRSNLIGVYSDSPLHIPPNKLYDLIYVSHGGQQVLAPLPLKLRQHLRPGGFLAILMRARHRQPNDATIASSFADSAPVEEARTLFKQLVKKRGYTLVPGDAPQPDSAISSLRHERIRFSIMAPANAVLLGELILDSLHEHIPDRARLDILNQTANRFRHLSMSVHEELELLVMGAAA